MSILVNRNTRVVVQGITGKEGSFHATQCKAYGTQVVAGVTPGKAGQEVEGIPVFNSVRDAVKKTEATTSLIFVPPPFASDAILEAAEAGVWLIICITEGIPVNDMVRVKRALQGKQTRLIGPNCPGITLCRNPQSRPSPWAGTETAKAERRQTPEKARPRQAKPSAPCSIGWRLRLPRRPKPKVCRGSSPAAAAPSPSKSSRSPSPTASRSAKTPISSRSFRRSA